MKNIKYKIFTLIVFLFSVGHYGQSKKQTFCFTEPSSKNEALYLSALKRVKAEDSYCLKVYVHVIRRTNGTGGQSVQDINQAMNILNTDFSPHQISFNWDNSIDYIDNDSYYNSAGSYIFNINNHSDGIDIYLYDDNSSAGGRANGVGNSSEFYVSGSYWNTPFNPLVTSSVISHEMGHVLFLWHTHHGCETGNWEPTNGSNCATTGDFVCDTPSDPHLGFNVNINNCEWTNVAQCAPPEPISNYNPDENIIMSYTHPGCMTYFTNGQGQRMRNAIATLPHLISASEKCDSDCIENIILNNTVFGSELIEVSNNITSYSTLQPTSKVIYSAGNRILLKATAGRPSTGFHAKAGSKFLAKIEECSNSLKSISKETLAEKQSDALPNKETNTIQSTETIKLYPNPTSKILNISSKENISHWEISNQMGKVLNKATINNRKTALFNIQNLPTGVYFVRITLSNGKQIIKRAIKN